MRTYNALLIGAITLIILSLSLELGAEYLVLLLIVIVGIMIKREKPEEIEKPPEFDDFQFQYYGMP